MKCINCGKYYEDSVEVRYGYCQRCKDSHPGGPEAAQGLLEEFRELMEKVEEDDKPINVSKG